LFLSEDVIGSGLLAGPIAPARWPAVGGRRVDSGVSHQKGQVAKTAGCRKAGKGPGEAVIRAALDAGAATPDWVRMFGEDEEFPYLWLDETYARCRDEGHVSSTAVVTAIACGRRCYRHNGSG